MLHCTNLSAILINLAIGAAYYIESGRAK